MKRNYCYAVEGAIILLVLIIFIFFIKPWMNESKAKKKEVKNEKGFEIYLVKEESISAAITHDANNLIAKAMRDENGKIDHNEEIVDINSLQLEDTPILTDKDIKQYDWTYHIIKLTRKYYEDKGSNDGSSNKRRYDGGSEVLEVDPMNAFVIMLNGKRLYSGGFLFEGSSCGSGDIGISDISEREIHIWCYKPYSDPRNNKEVYSFLKQKGKLIEPKKLFSEADAIKKVKDKYPELKAYPESEGKVNVDIPLGGIEKGKKIPGEFEIISIDYTEDPNKEARYTLMFREVWNSKDYKPQGSEDGALVHYKCFFVTPNNIVTEQEGGVIPPEAAK